MREPACLAPENLQIGQPVWFYKHSGCEQWPEFTPPADLVQGNSRVLIAFTQKVNRRWFLIVINFSLSLTSQDRDP